MPTKLSLSVVVTRPAPEGAALCQRITEAGGRALHFPTLAIAPPPDLAAFEQGILRLSEKDWLIFISPQGVYASQAAIRSVWPSFPATVKWAAMGKGTANALQQAGFPRPLYPATDWCSEGLLALPAFQDLSGKSVAIIRGVGGREHLEAVLSLRGAQVAAVVAYQRVLPVVSEAEWLALLQQPIDVIVCTSGDSVSHLKQLADEKAWPQVARWRLLVTSERIKRLAHDLGFQTIWVAKNASHDAILDALFHL